ncbi:hypothetical protein VTN96DRAFT_4661 [Rasamsonia emersonii]
MAESGSQSLPLIPKVATDRFDRRRRGFLIVITSDSYRSGAAPPRHIESTGPLWVIFDRKFPHKTCMDTTTRLESDPREAQAIGMAIEEIEVLPEKTEILVKRIQGTYDMRSDLWLMYQRSFQEDESPDYGLDEDEDQPTDQIEEMGDGPAEDTLNHQAQALSLSTDFKVTTGPGNAITVTSSSSSSNTMTSDPTSVTSSTRRSCIIVLEEETIPLRSPRGHLLQR